MLVPTVRGLIDRRILVNYRVDPAVMARRLPEPFRPKLFRGHAIGGICLIRLKRIRPAGWPAAIGIGSENAAHRIAVEWDEGGAVREGVYIPRRDTDSLLNALAGGRVFPGEHHRARFRVAERDDRLFVTMRSRDGGTEVEVEARAASGMNGSIFVSVDEASAFFEAGSLGYSATAEPGRFDGLQLACRSWRVRPLDVSLVRSSFFDDSARFARGVATFDSALLMRGIEHEWIGRPPLCCPAASPARPRSGA